VISIGEVSDSKCSSRIEAESRQPETTPHALPRKISKYFLTAPQKKRNHPEEAHERTGRMKALHSWKRDSLETPHDVETLERSFPKREKNPARRE